MSDFNAIAKDIFEVLREFDYTVRLYDADSMAVTEPGDARRFVCYPKNLLVVLQDDDDNSSITLTIGKSTHIDDVMGLSQNLRTLATKYNLVSKIQQSGRAIDPIHFARLAQITERKDRVMHVCEGFYGTSQSSYLRRDYARMIVRHNASVTDATRNRCVESISVEDTLGRRTLLPTRDLWIGRAMTEHLNRGGKINDPLGKRLIAIAEEQAHLAAGAHHAAAPMLREACERRRAKLRETVRRFAGPSFASEIEALHSLHESRETTDVTGMFRAKQMPKAVYEACGRALVEHQRAPTVDVAGRTVSASAWRALQAGQLDMSRPVTAQIALPAPLSMVSSTLHEVARRTTDRSLSSLFETVADRVGHGDKQAKSIAIMALRAAGVMEAALANKHAAVAEHVAWFDQFDPTRVLSEAPMSMMDPYADHDMYDRAADEAVAQFDPEDFVDSPQMQDVISGRNPHDPEENGLTKDEIDGALKSYLEHFVEMRNPEMEEYNDASSLIDAVYDKAVEALQSRGFVIGDSGLHEAEHDGEQLTIEDVLLPSKDKGADLSREVTTKDVADGDPQVMTSDRDAGTKRIMALAGMKA